MTQRSGTGEPVVPDTQSFAALEESEERFRVTMDDSAVAMNITGPDGRFLRVNAAMSRFFQREPGDLLRCTWQELTHPDDLAADEALAAQMMAGARDHYRIVKRYLRPDGSFVWGDLTVSCVREDDGGVRYAIAQIIDVTDREEALAARRESEELLRTLMDNAPVAMGVSTADGRFVRANDALSAFFGRSREDILAMTWQDLTPAEDVADEVRLVREMLAGTRDHYQLTKGFPQPDGGTKWGLLSVSCIRAAGGEVEFLVGQIVDVTGPEATRRLLEATLESMLDPFILLGAVRDERGTVVDLVVRRGNHAAAAYYSRELATLTNAPASALLTSGGLEEVTRWFERAMEVGELVLDEIPMPYSLYGPDQWLDVRAVRVGEAVAFTWRNVTERRVAAEERMRQEAQYRLLADNATDVIVRSDATSGIVWVSPSVTEVLGWQPDELVGRRMPEFMHPEDVVRIVSKQKELIASGRREGRTTARFATADGGWRWMSDHGRALMDADGAIIGGIDSLRDVQAEHDAAEEIARRGEELRGIIDSLVDPWVRLEAVRDDSGQIVDFVYIDANDAACRHNNVDRTELIGRRVLDLLPEHGPSGILGRYAAVVETGVPLADDEVPFTDANTGLRGWFDNRAVKVGDGISLTWRDVTDRHHARAVLAVEAEHDDLTGVANRRQLERRLAELLGGQRRTGTNVALLYLDLDFFKEVNDSAGHAVGDEVLTKVARRIHRSVRDHDIVARLGGDEFVVVLDAVNGPSDASLVAEKVSEAIRRPMAVGGSIRTITVSIGVAVADAEHTADVLMSEADRALYQAKRAGRDRVVVASDSG